MASPTIRSTCAIPGHPLYPHPQELKMTTPEKDIDPDPNVEEEETDIKARKVKKTHLK